MERNWGSRREEAQCWLMHCREGEKRRRNKGRRREERVKSINSHAQKTKKPPKRNISAKVKPSHRFCIYTRKSTVVQTGLEPSDDSHLRRDVI